VTISLNNNDNNRFTNHYTG